jgi:hypothetical protein
MKAEYSTGTLSCLHLRYTWFFRHISDSRKYMVVLLGQHHPMTRATPKLAAMVAAVLSAT